MKYTQEKLIQEEQEILNELIKEMDATILQIDKNMTDSILQAKKAKEKSLPDTYGLLVSAEYDKTEAKKMLKAIHRSRDELYDTRIIVECQDELGQEEIEVKIGLHSYSNGTNMYIMSWKIPLCRHYILDNSAEEYESIVSGKYGEKYCTHYRLKMKRKIDMFFNQVQSVNHLFPIVGTEMEEIVADEFLQELLKRRSEKEFRNIVFSIQKQQGKIIQTPFNQNLIVQGCAGSGKSMIMLHRLPIILYDNPNRLDRNNLYIITPSIPYIQMANNMRIDLEIEDLKMGTLEQYYDYVLQKYGIKQSVYRGNKSFIKTPVHMEQYIYSEQCITDIRTELEQRFLECQIDYSSGLHLFRLEPKLPLTNLVRDRIHVDTLSIQMILNANDNVLKEYHGYIKDILEKLEELSKLLFYRKISITRGIARKVSVEQSRIQDARKKQKKIIKEENELKYRNYENTIEAAKNRIEDLQESQEIVDLDDEYFNLLKKEAYQIDYIIRIFSAFKKNRENMGVDELYECICMKDTIWDYYKIIYDELCDLGDPYIDYVESMYSLVNKIISMIEKLRYLDKKYLKLEYLNQLKEANTYYINLSNSLVHEVYFSIMEKLGYEVKKEDKLKAFNCSPYLYLQIVYMFQGMPNGRKESLIIIDEAQNIAPVELQLIKAVNANQVILNLFGDVKQHIEFTKGIDDWKEIDDIAKFEIYNMCENYRNARQITNYCNNRFRLNMHAINTDGAGVHIIGTQKEFIENLRSIFTKAHSPGLRCIIVKDRKEAETILAMEVNFQDRIHNMITKSVDLHRTKWNLMTVDQAKGLEFATVFAITGRMGKNEKYITYTRALNELYVYDIEIPLIELRLEENEKPKPEKEMIINKKRKKREKKVKSGLEEVDDTNIGVKQFFKNAGLEVIDERNKNGFLWIIGEKSSIGLIVEQAMDKFGITGVYGSSKASGFRPSWYTKTKK